MNKPGGVIRRVPIGSIRPNDWNPNQMDAHMAAALEANMRRVGFVQPLLVRQDKVEVTSLGGEAQHVDGMYEIVDGEHRFHCAVKLGYTELPVCVVNDLSDAEARIQTLAMNRIKGEMEAADVARLIREVESDGINLGELAATTGYTLTELEQTRALLDFDWSTQGADDTPSRERGSGNGSGDGAGDRWVTLSYRVPESIANEFARQVNRVRRLTGFNDDHLAIEAMVAAVMQDPDEVFTA